MNNNKTSSKKTIIIFIVIIVLSILGYFYYVGSNTVPDSNLLVEQNSTVSAETQLAGSRVLSLLGQVYSLNIDKSIFESVVFKSLVDYTIEIPEQNVGRLNPFAPIGNQMATTTPSK